MENHTQGVTVCVRVRTSGLAFFRFKLQVTVVIASKKVLPRDVIVMGDFVVLMREFKTAVCTFCGGFMLADLIC